MAQRSMQINDYVQTRAFVSCSAAALLRGRDIWPKQLFCATAAANLVARSATGNSWRATVFAVRVGVFFVARLFVCRRRKQKMTVFFSISPKLKDTFCYMSQAFVLFQANFSVRRRRKKLGRRFSVFGIFVIRRDFVYARFGIRCRLEKTITSACLHSMLSSFFISFAICRRRRRFCSVRYLLNLHDNTHQYY